MARPKEAMTEAKRARIMVSLYPVRGWRRKTPAFRFGFVPIPGTPLGCCLDDRWPKRPLRGLVKEDAKANGRPFERVYGGIPEGRPSVLLDGPAASGPGRWSSTT